MLQVLLLTLLSYAHAVEDEDSVIHDHDSDSLLQLSKGTLVDTESSMNVLKMDDSQCFLMDVGAHGAAADKSRSVNTKLSANASITCDWNPTSVNDLSSHYEEIFASAQNNRNAASHLWAKFVIDRSACLSHEQIVHMFGGFCAVSGSTLGEPSASNRYKQELSLVAGGTKVGYSYHCCWPCFCDEKDYIKVDTKTLTDKDGKSKSYLFEVIGDPCAKNPAKCQSPDEQGCIPIDAPGVICEGGKLKNAILSDGGHPIIGMYFTDEQDIQASVGGDDKVMQRDDGSLVSLNWACDQRKDDGMQSGMGTIFVNVAKINPIS